MTASTIKKRICLVTQSYYLRDPRVRREAEALAHEGYEVDVIALAEQDRPAKETVNGVNISSIKINRKRATAVRYLLEYSLFFLATSAMLFARVFTRRYDLIHINNMPDFLVFSTVLPKLSGTKIVLDVHDPMAEIFTTKYGIGGRSFPIRFLRWQEKISLRFCHHILTVSDAMRERLEPAARGKPISVVLNLPDESIFHASNVRLEKPANSFVLLYTGTMSARYGLGIAIEAAARLRDDIPELKLLMVGEGDDLPVLRQMGDELELGSIVEFRLPVPLSKIPEIVSQCDVGISPHISDDFMRLYFSTKVAEFVSMGLPTVVTRTQTIEHYFSEDIVKYCESGSVESFVNAVLELYNSPELRDRMTENGRQLSQRWNWATEKKIYIEVVEQLLGLRTQSRDMECKQQGDTN
ncbi:MAG: glycosyltransferase family 4 protein [Armatimonadetes bacterium]|nr:glycosyltransferase family 4 protein [Armatimonadota bacterium]